MNITFTSAGKQLPTCLRFAVGQLMPRRCTCKIAVEVDNKLIEQLENNDVKPRHHPGIVKSDHLGLPTHISRALQRVIGDHPVKTVLKDCKMLNQYINARHPPPEAELLQSRKRKILEEADQRMPLENLADLSEEEQDQWKRKREQFIQLRMSQRNYAWKPIAYGPYEALVYAIGRGALEYAVLVRILHELKARDEHFKPCSYFDFGSGVGTGMWAASSLWQDSIYEYYNVDSSSAMHDLSELIMREGNENQQPTLRNVFYRQFLPGLETKYDLVVSSYSLFELPSAKSRKEVLLNLWRKCDGYLIIVEEGTRRGSELVNEAREYILGLQDESLRGHVFAPCPHNLTCPRLAAVGDNTPCNFEFSYAPLHLGVVSADRLLTRSSYVVLKKGEASDSTLHWPRLVRPTLVRSKHVVCRMCTANAKLQEIIFTQSKHGRSAYRCVKASRWGDRLPIAIAPEDENVEEDATDVHNDR